MKYRSRMEIVEIILRAANQGATKTRIMYNAYLSYAQVVEYLKFLQKTGLLALDAKKPVYRLTEKGLRFLHVCEELNGLMAESKPSVVREVEAEEGRKILAEQ
jgi:predicted transcriptional regulator